MDFSWLPRYSGLITKSLFMTLKLSGLAIVFGMILGVIVGVLLTSKVKPIKYILRAYVELFRGAPLLIQLFMVFFGLAYIHINISLSTTVILVFTLYTGAYVAEITRSGIESIPTGQWEAAHSIGLNYFQIMRIVILPQIITIALPSLIGFFIGMTKDTSLASIIGYSELVKNAQTVMTTTSRPFETYIVVGILYFIICYPMSRFVVFVEDRIRRRQKGIYPVNKTMVKREEFGSA